MPRRLNRKIARKVNTDTVTTVVGLVAGAVLASEVDYVKLVLEQDRVELGKVITAVSMALLGWLSNKKGKQTREDSE